MRQRHWFQDKDGTYYRNCPLIMDEQRELLDRLKGTNPWRVRRIRQFDHALDELEREWTAVFNEGIIRKAGLAPGDVVVQPAPFREVYPDKPGLWFLDEV